MTNSNGNYIDINSPDKAKQLITVHLHPQPTAETKRFLRKMIRPKILREIKLAEANEILSKSRPVSCPSEEKNKNAVVELANSGERSSNRNGGSTNPVDVGLKGKHTAMADDHTDSVTTVTTKQVTLTGIDQNNSTSTIDSHLGTTSPPQRIVDKASQSTTGPVLDPLQRHPSHDNSQVANLRPVLRRNCKRMSAYGLPPSPPPPETTTPHASPKQRPGIGKQENDTLEEGEIQD